MTASQITKAKTLAISNAVLNVDDTVLYGMALPSFQNVTVSLEIVAKFLRSWVLFNGEGFDESNLNDSGVYYSLRKKVTLT